MATFGRTWWGERFLEALARFTDPGRLGRGRSYAGNGRIVSYSVADGRVSARVRGSVNPYFGVYKEPLYHTTIEITQIPAEDWSRVIRRIAARADLIAKLLQQEMPDPIEEVFAEERLSLLPGGQHDFTTDCSCPDWDNPCKHIAGVYYLLARDLDRDPFVLLELRGLSREALRAELVRSPFGEILAAALQADADVPLAPVESFYTRPTRSQESPREGDRLDSHDRNGDRPGQRQLSHREFWLGARRLPPATPAAPARVPALLVKKEGDYPPFWPKDASFISMMEELYERVRTRSPQLK